MVVPQGQSNIGCSFKLYTYSQTSKVTMVTEEGGGIVYTFGTVYTP